MIRKILHRFVRSVERDLGVPADEAHYMVDHSPRAFWKFSSVRKWAEYRRKLPVDAYYIAKLATHRQEDCGSCLQISVNAARKHGIAPEMVRAAVDGRVDKLPQHLQAVYRFAEQQADRIDDDDLRQTLRKLYGEEGLIELALAITGARTFPTFKRALGYARSCSRVTVAV